MLKCQNVFNYFLALNQNDYLLRLRVESSGYSTHGALEMVHQRLRGTAPDPASCRTCSPHTPCSKLIFTIPSQARTSLRRVDNVSLHTLQNEPRVQELVYQ